MAGPPTGLPSTSAREIVLARIAVLLMHWVSFAEDPCARILVLRMAPREGRLLDVLCELEGSEDKATPDLFVMLDHGFEDGDSYSAALCRLLRSQWENDRAELMEQAPGWAPPHSDSLAAWMAALADLQHRAMPPHGHIALVLRPEGVHDLEAWQGWLRRWLAVPPPASVRVVLVESLSSPVGSALALQHPQEVQTVTPDVDYAGMAVELAENLGEPGPGREFNVLFSKLLKAIELADDAAIGHLTAQGLALCRAQSWPALGFAVQMATVTHFIQTSQMAAADHAYLAALGLAEEAQTADETTGARLVAQAALGRGSLLAQLGRPVEVVPLGLRSAQLALTHGDLQYSIEAWRLVVQAQLALDNEAEAWIACTGGLNVARLLPPAERKHTTLPLLGRLMLDRLEDGAASAMLRTELAALLGEGWEELA